jgi:hydrogenase-4 component E
MTSFLDPLLIVVLSINFFALGVSRIRGVIQAVAIQGVLLGLIPWMIHPELGVRGLALMTFTIVLKGLIIPGFLVRAMREVDTQHEDKPLVGYMSSILLGAVGTGLALEFSSKLPLAAEHADLLIVPASLATVWTGFLLLTTRHKAIMQVLGYLVLENGIFLLSLLLLEAMPFLVEVGVLLDLFTGVFVMGIIIHHIHREFASMSTEYLSALKE